MPSLAELKKECQVLGVEVIPSDAKAPYLAALRSHYLKRDYPNGLPYEELCPMLCFPYWDLTEKEQGALWENHDWIAQKKLNGCRLILYFVKGVGVFAHSRSVSLHSYRRTELTDRLLFSGFKPDFTATVDTEVLCDQVIDTRSYTQKGEITQSSLHSTSALLHMEPEASKRLQRDQAVPLTVHVFDITNWQGEDLRAKKLCERLTYLSDFQKAIEFQDLNIYFNFSPTVLQDKRGFYDQVIAAGGEGIVLKNLNSPYIDSTSRSRSGWVKVKRQIEIDAYVSGFERGRSGSKWEICVASLIFSVNTDKGHHTIAKVSNIPWVFRKKISHYDAKLNQLKLDVGVYGKVARLSGMEVSQRAFRLVYPNLVFWRPNLRQEDCVYAMSDLHAARMGAPIQPLRTVNPSS